MKARWNNFTLKVFLSKFKFDVLPGTRDRKQPRQTRIRDMKTDKFCHFSPSLNPKIHRLQSNLFLQRWLPVKTSNICTQSYWFLQPSCSPCEQIQTVIETLSPQNKNRWLLEVMPQWGEWGRERGVMRRTRNASCPIRTN